jgi:hypothetical protein
MKLQYPNLLQSTDSGGQFYWYTKPGMPICRKVKKMKSGYVNLL